MKKFLSLMLVMVMVMSISIPAFADKPAWAGNNKKGNTEIDAPDEENVLPKGLDKKVVPFGHRKDKAFDKEDLSVLDELISEVEEYIENLPVDVESADESEEIDEDEDEDEDIVDSISNLIARIRSEIGVDSDDDLVYNEEISDKKLQHYLFQLEKKYSVLQKKHGENEIDYNLELIDLREDLNDVKGDEVFTTTQAVEIEALIQEIDDELYIDGDSTKGLKEDLTISKDLYNMFRGEAKKYFKLLDKIVDDSKVMALKDEIIKFITTNEFGLEKGQYSQGKAMKLIDLIIDYNTVVKTDEEALKEYYNQLNNAFKKFKMSKIVAGTYLKTLESYGEDLDEYITDENLTTGTAVDLRADISAIEADGKITLGIFYDIEEQVLELLNPSDQNKLDFDKLIQEVKETFLANYKVSDLEKLKEDKMILVGEYFVAIASQVSEELQKALDAFNKMYEDHRIK